jgi:DNA-binding protein Fis
MNLFAPVEWTEPMLKLIKELRKSGYNSETCAAQVGVGRDTMQKKLKELGLNQRMNRGRTKGNHVRR